MNFLQAVEAASEIVAQANQTADDLVLHYDVERANACNMALVVLIADALRGHFHRGAGLPSIWPWVVLVTGAVIGGGALCFGDGLSPIGHDTLVLFTGGYIGAFIFKIWQALS